MRIDVLLTGQYPSSCDWKDLSDSLYRVYENLVYNNKHDVRVYYHSWDRPETHRALVPVNKYMRHAKKHVFLDQMPMATYNPYQYLPKFVNCEGWKNQVEQHINEPWNREQYPQPGHITRALQLISTNLLIKRIQSDPPDLYIRVRWDCLLSYHMDYMRFAEHVIRFNEPVGFMMDAIQSKTFERTRKRFETAQFYVEKRSRSNIKHEQMLLDAMVMFKPEWWDCDLVNWWWQTEKLLAAEWGWWQVLCYVKKLNHLNVNGGPVIIRHLRGLGHKG